MLHTIFISFDVLIFISKGVRRKRLSPYEMHCQSRTVSTYTALRAGVYLESDILPHCEIDAVDPKGRHKGNLETEAQLESKVSTTLL
ncbi:hypothetical protein HanPSC8_Chr11g0485341 [Helianthus annuus]|nr:hypothetical protein HanPSC8_Chr11g0485341 [Helianthus annuus]